MKSKNHSQLQVDPRIAFFNHHAPTWDSNGPDMEKTLSRVAALESLLDLRAGEHLLEVGCGTGQLTPWLAERVEPGHVLAVDFAPAMLEQARTKNPHLDFRHVDICQVTPDPRAFDVVLCFHCFPHLRDQSVGLANMAGAVKPGGRVIVMHLSGREQINAFHDQVGGAVEGDHLPDDEQWRLLMQQARLTRKQFINREDLFFMEMIRE